MPSYDRCCRSKVPSTLALYIWRPALPLSCLAGEAFSRGTSTPIPPHIVSEHFFHVASTHAASSWSVDEVTIDISRSDLLVMTRCSAHRARASGAAGAMTLLPVRLCTTGNTARIRYDFDSTTDVIRRQTALYGFGRVQQQIRHGD